MFSLFLYNTRNQCYTEVLLLINNYYHVTNILIKQKVIGNLLKVRTHRIIDQKKIENLFQIFKNMVNSYTYLLT